MRLFLPVGYTRVRFKAKVHILRVSTKHTFSVSATYSMKSYRGQKTAYTIIVMRT